MQTIIREEDVMLLQKQLSRQMPTVAIKERIKTLKHLRSVILSHLDEIEQALFEDLHKSREESYMTETGIVLSEISYQLKHLKHWSRKKRVRSSLSLFPSKAYRVPQAYGVVLIGQQLCVLVGLRNMPLFNLQNQFYLSITKLPALTLEPSHSARILTFAMLGYLRCLEIKTGKKLTIQEWFDKEHRTVTFLFLWSMLMMGSGTAFIGVGILGLYFITKKTAIYIIPALIGLFIIGQSLELKHMDRVVTLAASATTGDAKAMQQADGSGASRLIPLVNAFTKTDLTELETWIGKTSMEKDKYWWMRTETKIYDQYGLLAFLISLIFVYACVINHFFSLETLLFLGLLGLSITNIYYLWGCFMIMTGVRYFQNNYVEHSVLITTQNKDYEN